jgi:hypothetical protein
MLRLIAFFLLVLSTQAFSEEGSPREPESKAEAAQGDNQHGSTPKQITVPANSSGPTVININTGKHANEESHCARPKHWKEWGSFAWCSSLEWIDAERIIAAFTVVLGIATGILGIATWKLWRATDALVTGADKTAERQLRAYVSIEPVGLQDFVADRRPRVTFIVKNIGQTPAHRVRIVGDMDIFPHPLPNDQPDLVIPDPNAGTHLGQLPA